LSELAQRLLAGERDAVPEALNLVDDARPERREEALALLDALERGRPGFDAARVGFTGAPGSGKSTLLDAVVRHLREQGQNVGIVAIDPSSRVSGGALLGDRLRMRTGARDPGVFVRSMAARERLGGLADATRASLVILSSVFEWVFVETVGVGQSESEVTSLVDTLVYVLQPGAGDTLQFMKAGLLEHPDVHVVNKADLGAVAERSAAELKAALGLSARDASEWTPRVLLASARDGRGVESVVEALHAHRRSLQEAGGLAERRRQGAERYVLRALERRYGTYGLERIGGREALAERLRTTGDLCAFSVVRSLGHEIEDTLRKPD
jgi:LAO/AO transport system kinase